MGPVLAVGVCREARAWSLQGGPRPMGPGRAGPMRSSVAAPDCCGGLGNLDFRKADLCVMTRLLGYVDPSEPHFVAAVLTIAFNPLFWNVLHAGHAEPAQDAEPGQPLGLPHGPGTPGSGRHVCPFQFPGSGLHRDLPRRLLRDPEGDQSDHVPIQRPGQPHVLGQHSQLPGLGHHAADSVLERLGWEAPCPRPGSGIRALRMRPRADLRLRRQLWMPASGPPSKRLAQGITLLAPQSSSRSSIFWMRTSSIESCFCRKCSA
ncbi:phosphatidylethanolamine N-methyltransferase isoform X2 [Orcinus orca]|uniref:phosphatidylethanolamine N-methyltransferase isoform X2 n=1 Tax=Orcinus orca TaxID=9733 RepID=UPI002112E1F4|nr:phosphatidylethanolamine N-methyltransferase isoform X2 [Orcinus orca]